MTRFIMVVCDFLHWWWRKILVLVLVLLQDFSLEATQVISCNVLLITWECFWEFGSKSRLASLEIRIGLRIFISSTFECHGWACHARLTRIFVALSIWSFCRTQLKRQKGGKALPLRFMHDCWKVSVPLLYGSGFHAKYAGTWCDTHETKRSVHVLSPKGFANFFENYWV